MTKFRFLKGDTFRAILTVTDDLDAAVDLTGATVEFTLYDRNGNTLHNETITSHSDPTAGETTVVFTAAESAALTMGAYEFTAVTTLADTEVWSIDEGLVEITE